MVGTRYVCFKICRTQARHAERSCSVIFRRLAQGGKKRHLVTGGAIPLSRGKKIASHPNRNLSRRSCIYRFPSSHKYGCSSSFFCPSSLRFLNLMGNQTKKKKGEASGGQYGQSITCTRAHKHTPRGNTHAQHGDAP